MTAALSRWVWLECIDLWSFSAVCDSSGLDSLDCFYHAYVFFHQQQLFDPFLCAIVAVVGSHLNSMGGRIQSIFSADGMNLWADAVTRDRVLVVDVKT